MKNYQACKEIILIPIGKSCFFVSAHIPDKQEKSIIIIHQTKMIHCRDQARGRLGQNSRARGRNNALNGTQGEVCVYFFKKKLWGGDSFSFCHHTNASCGNII